MSVSLAGRHVSAADRHRRRVAEFGADIAEFLDGQDRRREAASRLEPLAPS